MGQRDVEGVGRGGVVRLLRGHGQGCSQLAPSTQLAVGQDRGVVGGIAHVGVDGVVVRSVVVLAVVLGTADREVAQGAELLGDAVERGRGDHQQTEEADEDQERQHDGTGAEEVEQQRGDHVADGAAAVAQRRGVARDRLGVAGGHVDDAEHSEGERGPPDGLPARRTVGDRVTHHAPAGPHDSERHQPTDLADRADHRGSDELHQPTGQLEPHTGCHDDRQPDEEQPGAVAAVLGIELASGVTQTPSTRADGVRRGQPRSGEGAEQEQEEAGYRARARPDRTRRRPRGRTARGGSLAARRLLAGRLLGSGATGTLGRRAGAGGGGLLPGARGSRTRAAPATTAAAGSCGRRARAARTRRGRRTGRHVANLGDRLIRHMDHRSVSPPLVSRICCLHQIVTSHHPLPLDHARAGI